MPGRKRLNFWAKFGIGCGAGFVGALIKGGLHEYPFLMRLIDTGQDSKVMPEIIGFIFWAIILIVCGGLSGWYSRSNDPRTIFKNAVTLPLFGVAVLAGNYSEPHKGFLKVGNFEIISSAHAADNPVGGISFGAALFEGIKLNMGFGKDQSRYYVVVGPYKNEAEASAVGMALMKQQPSLPVFSGDPDKSRNIALILGYPLPYSDAKVLRDKIKESSVFKNNPNLEFHLTTDPPSTAVKQSK